MENKQVINNMPMRQLGSTGVYLTVLGLGGYHLGTIDKKLAIRIMRTAIDEGINFLDNAWCYNAGRSEEVMGEALLDGYRDKVFLMTKNHGRDQDAFNQQLEESLVRLQTDHIDLLQFHEIVNEGDPQKIFSQGAVKAAISAREEGKIKYIGFTGHRYPFLFKEMLEYDFDWDTVQMPVNLLDFHYRSFAREILPILKERKIGVIAMKSLAGGAAPLLNTGVSAREAISYALSQPIDTLVSGIDSLEILKENLETVRNFNPLSLEKQQELLDKVALSVREGRYEWYKA